MTPPLQTARRLGAACGVTRVADLTGLDVLGLPVFQAVRPWSRALCTHQGKGLKPEAAELGALMEAVESHGAEGFDGPVHVACYSGLPPSERAPAADDFSLRRGLDVAGPLAWTPAESFVGGRLWVPWLAVSLDLTRPHEPVVERGSNGLAAGFRPEAARLAALCEVLERDAVDAWWDQDPLARIADRLDLTSIEAPWLQAFAAAALDHGVIVALFGLRSRIGWPVIVCGLDEPSASDRRRARVFGSACRPDADAALEAAVSEAAQSRATAIAAVRDDILPQDAAERPLGVALPTPPPSAGVRRRRFETLRRGPPACAHAAAAALATDGYPQAAWVDVGAPPPAVVVKVFVPGLRFQDRRRRAPQRTGS